MAQLINCRREEVASSLHENHKSVTTATHDSTLEDGTGERGAPRRGDKAAGGEDSSTAPCTAPEAKPPRPHVAAPVLCSVGAR